MATTRIMPLHVGKGRTESRAISDIIDYVPISTTKFRRLFEIDSFTRQFSKRRSVLLLAL